MESIQNFGSQKKSETNLCKNAAAIFQVLWTLVPSRLMRLLSVRFVSPLFSLVSRGRVYPKSLLKAPIRVYRSIYQFIYQSINRFGIVAIALGNHNLASDYSRDAVVHSAPPLKSCIKCQDRLLEAKHSPLEDDDDNSVSEPDDNATVTECERRLEAILEDRHRVLVVPNCTMLLQQSSRCEALAI